MFCNITITERATDQHIFHMYLPLLTVLLLYSPAIAFTSTIIAWLSLNFILETSWVALYSVVCLSVSEASVTPDQISTLSNKYRNTSPLLTLYHLIPSSTNLYWPSTSQYCHILTQYHQVPLIIHHLVRHSSVNWIISHMTHMMSHAQYTWSSLKLDKIIWLMAFIVSAISSRARLLQREGVNNFEMVIVNQYLLHL